MKKVLSIALVLAMMIMPITIYAVNGTGTSSDPYLLNNTDTEPTTLVIPAESDVWLKVNNSNGSVLTVTNSSSTSYFFWYCMQTFNSATSLTTNPGVDKINLMNTGSSDLSITLKLTGGADELIGIIDNPEVLELTPNEWSGTHGAYVTTELEAGNEGYYYSVIAPADGAIAVSVSAFDVNNDYAEMPYVFSVNNLTTLQYSETIYSSALDDYYYNEIVEVSAGDEIQIFAATNNPNNRWNNPAGSIGVNVAFSPIGTSGCPEETTLGDHAFTAEANGNGYYYKWTATEEGTATVTMNTETDWQYEVKCQKADGSFSYGDTHWSDDEIVITAESRDVQAGDTLVIFVNTYSASSFTTPAGTIDWTLSFVAGEVGEGGNGEGGNGEGGDDIGGGETTECNYTESSLPITVGNNSYPVSNMFEYTVFMFEPDKAGKYTFTSENALLAIVSSNGMWITVGDSTDSISDGIVTENNFEWLCTDVGQSIWVAVKADENDADINVTYEEVEIKKIPKEYYENKKTPTAFTFNGDADALNYVDTFDSEVNKAVLGKDGYYHLDSENGPILFANLDDIIMSLKNANDYGQIKELIYQGEEVVNIIDFTLAMIEYLACMDTETGLYPLTEDLINVFSRAGKSLGWYGENGWIGGEEEDAWMFACYYDDSITTSNDVVTGGVNGNNGAGANNAPVTGDNLFVIFSLLTFTVAAAATVLFIRKRRYSK